MTRSANIALPALCIALLVHAPLAPADERIEGAVIGTQVTYCEAGKQASCKGTLTLQRDVGGRRERLAIRVPLGTPISRGCETVPLHRLSGQTVIVTEDARVAKAIEAEDGVEAAC